MADKAGELNAFAAEGPTGAAAYRAAQSGVSAQRAQALQDASNRSGAAYAPAEFRAQQATRVGAPLDASIQGLSAMGNAAGQYQGAQSAAQAGFISNLGGVRNLMQDQVRGQADQDYIKALNDVNSFMERQQSQQEKLANAQEKQKKALDAQNKDFRESAKQFALQDATVDQTIDGDTLDALGDTLKKYNSLEEALGAIQRATDPETGGILDGNGEPTINKEALLKYVYKAYSNGEAQNSTPFSAGDRVQGQASGSALTGDDAAAFKALYG